MPARPFASRPSDYAQSRAKGRFQTVAYETLIEGAENGRLPPEIEKNCGPKAIFLASRADGAQYGERRDYDGAVGQLYRIATATSRGDLTNHRPPGFKASSSKA